MGSRIKMKEIAEQAGVSISTVSRVLSGKDNVNAETRDRIYSVLNKINSTYHDVTHPVSRKNILVISANLSHLMHLEMLRAISASADENGYRMIVEITNDRLLSFEEFYQRIIDNNVVGVIVLAIMAKFETLEQINRIVPVVYSADPTEDYRFSFVGAHLKDAYNRLTSYLIAQGRRHIAVLFPMRYVSNGILDAYKEALEQYNFQYDPDIIVRPDKYDYTYILSVLTQLFRTHKEIDAIMCENDTLALAAITAAQKNHLSVPEDIAVLGFGCTFLSQISNPGITSIEVPLDTYGYSLFNELIRHVESEDLTPSHIYIDYHLIIRESTQKI